MTVPAEALRAEVSALQRRLEAATREVGVVLPTGSDALSAARGEIDALQRQLVQPTEDILNAADSLMALGERVRPGVDAGAAGGLADEIVDQANAVLVSCSFQDLTNQRTMKIVRLLEDIAAGLDRIRRALDGETDALSGPTAADDALLSGPADPGAAPRQSDVDRLFGPRTPS